MKKENLWLELIPLACPNCRHIVFQIKGYLPPKICSGCDIVLYAEEDDSLITEKDFEVKK